MWNTRIKPTKYLYKYIINTYIYSLSQIRLINIAILIWFYSERFAVFVGFPQDLCFYSQYHVLNKKNFICWLQFLIKNLRRN